MAIIGLARRASPADTADMEFRAASHADVRARRFRASATIAVSLSVGSPAADEVDRTPRRAAPPGYVPLGLREPGTTWGDLPPRVLPSEWAAGQAAADAPGSLVSAETARRPEGYTPAG